MTGDVDLTGAPGPALRQSVIPQVHRECERAGLQQALGHGNGHGKGIRSHAVGGKLHVFAPDIGVALSPSVEGLPQGDHLGRGRHVVELHHLQHPGQSKGVICLFLRARSRRGHGPHAHQAQHRRQPSLVGFSHLFSSRKCIFPFYHAQALNATINWRFSGAPTKKGSLSARQAAKTPVSQRYRRFCYRGEGGNQRSQADRRAVRLRFQSLGGGPEYKFIIHGRY